MSDRITGKTFNYSKIISGRTGNKELNRVQLFKGRTSLSNNAWDWNEILGEADFDYCLLLESDEEVQLFVLLKDNTLKGELIESLPEDIDNEEYNSFIILRKQLN